MWTFYIYTLLRFFKFPYNFCGDFRRTCNPRDNYMHSTGYVLRHGEKFAVYGSSGKLKISPFAVRPLFGLFGM